LWNDHLVKFKRDCEFMNIIPPDIQFADVEQVVLHNNAKLGHWRLKIVASGRKDSSRGLARSECEFFIISMTPFTEDEIYQEENYHGVVLNIYPIPCYIPFAQQKTLAHLPRFMIAQYAKDSKVHDSIVRTENGILLETSFSNIFWVNDRVVYFPDISLPYYHGAALSCLLQYFQIHEFLLKSGFYLLDEIQETACVYRISSFLLDPIVAIEGRKFARNIDFENEFIDAFRIFKLTHSTSI